MTYVLDWLSQYVERQEIVVELTLETAATEVETNLTITDGISGIIGTNTGVPSGDCIFDSATDQSAELNVSEAALVSYTVTDFASDGYTVETALESASTRMQIDSEIEALIGINVLVGISVKSVTTISGTYSGGDDDDDDNNNSTSTDTDPRVRCTSSRGRPPAEAHGLAATPPPAVGCHTTVRAGLDRCTPAHRPSHSGRCRRLGGIGRHLGCGRLHSVSPQQVAATFERTQAAHLSGSASVHWPPAFGIQARDHRRLSRPGPGLYVDYGGGRSSSGHWQALAEQQSVCLMHPCVHHPVRAYRRLGAIAGRLSMKRRCLATSTELVDELTSDCTRTGRLAKLAGTHRHDIPFKLARSSSNPCCSGTGITPHVGLPAGTECYNRNTNASAARPQVPVTAAHYGLMAVTVIGP